MATVVIQPNAAAGKDTYVNEGDPASNFGNATVMSVGRTSFADSRFRSLLAFDLASLPEGEGVSAATVALHCSGGADSTARAVAAHEVTAVWAEDAATWGNQPSYAASPEASCNVAAAGDYSWTLTDLFKAWRLGSKTNNGMCFVGVEGVAEDTYKHFSTSDEGTADQRPKATITTTARPEVEVTTPTGTQAAPGAVNDTTTPDLEGVYWSQIGLPMAYCQVKVYDELGNTVWDSGKVAKSVPSLQFLTLPAIPTGYLRYGKKYRWDWMAWDVNGGYSKWFSELWPSDGWFLPTLTTAPAATDLAAGDHLYAMTPTGRIVALEEGTTNLGAAIAWLETFVMPMHDPLDWLVPTIYLTRVRAKLELPVGSTASVYYSTALSGTDWETAFALTPATGVQIVDIAVPFTAGDDFSSHEFRLKIAGTGPHKLFALAFEYEERDS